MYNLIEPLSMILPVVALGLLFLVLFIKIYTKTRRMFPTSVNCWFCNTWTKVAYDDRDSFECPSCLQYNGFTKDGGYNKIIPEQHDELLNGTNTVKKQSNLPNNGLCKLCNNNQQLKIFQLANFVPLNEDNYDVEIEHFRSQLDKAYKLCKKCDKVLKTILEKQNAWIFGNHIKKMKSKLMLLNFNKSSCGIIAEYKQNVLLKTAKFFTGTFAFLVLISIVRSKINLNDYIPEMALPYATLIENFSAVIKNNIKCEMEPALKYFPKRLENYMLTGLACVGFIFQIGLIWDKYSSNVKVNQFLCWIILLLTTGMRLNTNNIYAVSFVLVIQVFSSIYIVYTTVISPSQIKQVRKEEKFSGKAIRRLVRNLETTYSDNSSLSSDFDEYSDKMETSTISWNRKPAESVHNASFTTGKNAASRFENLLSSQYDWDINKSLGNLHLGNFQSKTTPSPPPFITSAGMRRPKPILSPSKFNQNSWVAGGFWKNPDVPVKSTLSRTSSESSGFESQTNDNGGYCSLPPSRNNSLYAGDFDKRSMTSEPAYHFGQNVDFGQPKTQLYYRNDNTFYPILNQSNMLLIQGNRTNVCSPNCYRPLFFNGGLLTPNRSVFRNWSDKINLETMPNFRDLSQEAKNFVFK